MIAAPAPTGRGIRVAVIDSGVHAEHPHIDARRLAAGVAVTRDGAIEHDADAPRDRLGHGTAVTAAIQERAPGADILTVRVFRDALRASAVALIAAIDWSVEAGADIVNLSLGSTNAAHRGAFEEAVARAEAAGALVVAARAVDAQPCWPGALPGVLGVELDWECPRGSCRGTDDGLAVAAAGYPRPIPGVPPARNLYGVSFAVAQVSGIAACAAQRLRAATPGVDLPSALRAALIQGEGDGPGAVARPASAPN